MFLGVQEQWKDFMGDLQLLAVRYAYLSPWGCTQDKDVYTVPSSRQQLHNNVAVQYLCF